MEETILDLESIDDFSKEPRLKRRKLDPSHCQLFFSFFQLDFSANYLCIYFINADRHVKHCPHRMPASRTDIYLSRTVRGSDVRQRVFSFLSNEENHFITIHALGSLIRRAIKLAIWLKEKMPDRLQLYPSTSTVTIVDDFEPLVDNLAPITSIRYNNAIHIRVAKS